MSSQSRTVRIQDVVWVHHWGKNRPAIIIDEEDEDIVILICGSGGEPRTETVGLTIDDERIMKVMGLPSPTFFKRDGVEWFSRHHIRSISGRCPFKQFAELKAAVVTELEAARKAAQVSKAPKSGPHPTVAKPASGPRPKGIGIVRTKDSKGS